MQIDLNAWIERNLDDLVVGIILIIVGFAFAKIATIKWGIPKFVTVILQMKLIEILSFFFQYLLSPLTVIYLTIENYDKPFSYKTTFALILIFFTYTFNILMNYILHLYDMLNISMKKKNEELEVIRKALDTVYQHIEIIAKNQNDLKNKL